MLKHATVAVGLALWASAAYGQEVPPPLPTADDVRKQVDAGEYRPALQGLTRILALKDAAGSYDRAEMLLLRAECQLQIRETKAATESLNAALKEAAAQSNGDHADQALVLLALISKSPNLQYLPKTRSGPLAPKPINLLDRATRSAACKALFDDELADARQKIHAAAGARTMAPILDAAKTVATLRALEQAGTGGQPQSKKLSAELSAQAVALLNTSLHEMSGAVEGMTTTANEVVTLPQPRYDPVSGKSWLDHVVRKRGLSPDDVRTLKTFPQTCEQIAAATRDLSLALATDKDSYRDLAADAATLSDRITALLAMDFSAPAKP